MKKVLFGIMALSMAAFAANPGELTSGAGTASVPVKVLAEVIAPTDALVITDEAGNILADGIVLDHGLRTQTDGNHTTAPFRFKVKRITDGTSGYAPINGTLTVALDDVDSTTNNQEVHLGKIGGDPNVTGDKLVSTLALANGGTLSGLTNVTTLNGKHGYQATMSDTQAEHTGEITSTVNFSAANPGKFDSTADPSGNGTATLKVVLGA